MKAKAKPDGVTEADWERTKSAMLGDGYYIAGAAACTKSGWIECDRNLKLAVPYVSKDPRTLGIAYFTWAWRIIDRQATATGTKVPGRPEVQRTVRRDSRTDATEGVCELPVHEAGASRFRGDKRPLVDTRPRQLLRASFPIRSDPLPPSCPVLMGQNVPMAHSLCEPRQAYAALSGRATVGTRLAYK